MNGVRGIVFDLLYLVPSYNQPKFCSNASWNLNATIIADNNTVGKSPTNLFVDTNNTIYVIDRSNRRVQIWLNSSVSPTRTISGNLSSPFALFVTTSGDLYVDNLWFSDRIEKWPASVSMSIPIVYVNVTCFGIFVDMGNNLYCSMGHFHQITKIWLNDVSGTLTIVAGNGTVGYAANMLYNPHGISSTLILIYM
jgi:hypothetical protein